MNINSPVSYTWWLDALCGAPVAPAKVIGAARLELVKRFFYEGMSPCEARAALEVVGDKSEQSARAVPA